MKTSILILAAVAAGAASADPSARDVAVSRDATTGKYTVTYKLDAPAVVTADVRVNGVAAGLNASVPMAGDVNRLVTNVNKTCTLTWTPSGSTVIPTGADVSVAVTAWATNAPPDWMVINLRDPYEVRYYTTSNAIPGGVLAPINKVQKLVMRKIPARGVSWKMGAVESTSWPTREARHTVTLTEDYYIGVFPVTVGQFSAAYGYQALLSSDANRFPQVGRGYNNIRGKTSDGIDWPNTTPLHKVKTGSDIDQFRTTTGFEMDLPTDAQWEYACRAGEGAPLNNGKSGEEEYAKIASYQGNNGVAAVETGLYPPNAWGLYDMHGNVQEWCLDWIDEDVELTDETDPKGVASSPDGTRVTRGGAWNYSYLRGRSAFREALTPDSNWASLGFRLVCPAVAVR